MPITTVKQTRPLLPAIILLSVIIGATIMSRADALAGAESAGAETVAVCLGGAPGIPLLLAQEKGLFAAEGLVVELKKYRTGAEGFEGFFRGDCQMAAVSETSVVLKSFERQDFSILATIATSDNSPRLLASKRSGIAAPKDLRGKRIFVLKWSSNHFFLDMFLASNGLSKRDVQVLTDGVPDVPAAFADGTIDAFCATEVLIDKSLKALGKEAVVFDSPGLCLVSFHLVAMKSLISARPAVVSKVVAALLHNEERVKRDRGAAVKSAAAALGIDEPVMHGIWNNYNWSVGLAQMLLLSLEQEAQWAMDAGFTPKTRMPNYLDFVSQDALLALKPQAVTMLKGGR